METKREDNRRKYDRSFSKESADSFRKSKYRETQPRDYNYDKERDRRKRDYYRERSDKYDKQDRYNKYRKADKYRSKRSYSNSRDSDRSYNRVSKERRRREYIKDDKEKKYYKRSQSRDKRENSYYSNSRKRDNNIKGDKVVNNVENNSKPAYKKKSIFEDASEVITSINETDKDKEIINSVVLSSDILKSQQGVKKDKNDNDDKKLYIGNIPKGLDNLTVSKLK